MIQDSTKNPKAKKISRALYTDPELMAWRLAEYFYKCYEKEEPLLLSGLYQALGTNRFRYAEYMRGDKDHCIDKDSLSREGDVSDYLKIYRERDELYPYFVYVWYGTIPPQGSDCTRRVMAAIDDKWNVGFSMLLENARLILETDVEKRLIGGKVGDIMRAKVILGWQDEKVTVNKLELPKKEKEERLEKLGYKKLGDK